MARTKARVFPSTGGKRPKVLEYDVSPPPPPPPPASPVAGADDPSTDAVVPDGRNGKAKAKPPDAPLYVDLCNVLLDDSRVDRVVAAGYVWCDKRIRPGRGTAPRCVLERKFAEEVTLLTVTVEATVPEGCVPGDRFHIRTAYGGRVKVIVPEGGKPGDKICYELQPALSDRFKLKRKVGDRRP